jgi:hypothetical protein
MNSYYVCTSPCFSNFRRCPQLPPPYWLQGSSKNGLCNICDSQVTVFIEVQSVSKVWSLLLIIISLYEYVSISIHTINNNQYITKFTIYSSLEATKDECLIEKSDVAYPPITCSEILLSTTMGIDAKLKYCWILQPVQSSFVLLLLCVSSLPATIS